MPKVVIKLRDLDTDERTETSFEIDRVPDNALRQGQHLAELVAERYPDARQRSFADGVASFVAAQHLIVAKYLDGTAADDSRDGAEADPEHRQGQALQDQLFAA
ncbi:MAG: hypothetical protein ACRDLO_06215 [Solirubrobacterales bacterium]